MPRLKLQRTFHHDFSRTDQNMRVIRENEEFDKILKEYRDVNDLLIKKKNNYCGDEIWYGKSSLSSAIKRFDDKLEELNYNIKKIKDTQIFKKAGKNKAYIKQLEKIKLFEDEINNEINRLEMYSKGYENNLKICAKLKDEIKKNNEEYFKKTPYKDFIPLTKVKEKRLLKLYNELVDYYDEFYAKYSKMKNLYNDFTNKYNHNKYELEPLYEEEDVLKAKIEKYKRPPKTILAQLEENRIKIWEKRSYYDILEKEFRNIAGKYPYDFKVELDEKARQFKHIEARTRMMEKILNKEKHLYKEPINKNAEQMANLKKLIEKHENINKDTQNEIIQEKEFIKNIKIPKPIEKPKPNYRDLQEKLKKTIEEQEQIYKDTQKEIIQDKKYIETFSEEYQKFKNRVDKLIPKKQETIKETIKDVKELKVNLKFLDELENLGRTKEIERYVPDDRVSYLISLIFSEKYKTECPVEPIYTSDSKSGIKMDFKKHLKAVCSCIKKGETVIVIPVLLEMSYGGNIYGHANMMIIKVETREIYRYEPHGRGEEIWQDQVKPLWKNFTNGLNKCLSLKNTPFKYISTSHSCPRLNNKFRLGIQQYEKIYNEEGKMIEKEGGGYCQLFSFLFAECYITNKDMPFTAIYEHLLDYIKNDAEKAVMIIRGYLHEINIRLNKIVNLIESDKIKIAVKENQPINHLLFARSPTAPFKAYITKKQDIIKKKKNVFKGNGKY
jgi:hypothetical protein